MAGTYVLLWPKLFSPGSKATGGFQVPGAGSKATSAGDFVWTLLRIHGNLSQIWTFFNSLIYVTANEFPQSPDSKYARHKCSNAPGTCIERLDYVSTFDESTSVGASSIVPPPCGSPAPLILCTHIS
jgi:hypothetical protein